ncbi:MAG: hypothetical protein V4692_15440 [Bdellovibrionota bacterium]
MYSTPAFKLTSFIAAAVAAFTVLSGCDNARWAERQANTAAPLAAPGSFEPVSFETCETGALVFEFNFGNLSSKEDLANVYRTLAKYPLIRSQSIAPTSTISGGAAADTPIIALRLSLAKTCLSDNCIAQSGWNEVQSELAQTTGSKISCANVEPAGGPIDQCDDPTQDDPSQDESKQDQPKQEEQPQDEPSDESNTPGSGGGNSPVKDV